MGKSRRNNWKRNAHRFSKKRYSDDLESQMTRRAEREELVSKRFKTKI